LPDPVGWTRYMDLWIEVWIWLMKTVGQWMQVQIVLSFASLLKSPSHEFILSHCSGKQPSTFLAHIASWNKIIIGSNGPKLQSQAYNAADPCPLLGIATAFYFIFLSFNSQKQQNCATVVTYFTPRCKCGSLPKALPTQ
jgi:hypothetical protein